MEDTLTRSAVESVVTDKGLNINMPSGTIYVDGEFDSLVLYNISGGKVLESSQNGIGTSTLASGIYLAHINSKKQTVTKKIMISR